MPTDMDSVANLILGLVIGCAVCAVLGVLFG